MHVISEKIYELLDSNDDIKFLNSINGFNFLISAEDYLLLNSYGRKKIYHCINQIF
jgi:hypothetical protein